MRSRVYRAIVLSQFFFPVYKHRVATEGMSDFLCNLVVSTFSTLNIKQREDHLKGSSESAMLLK